MSEEMSEKTKRVCIDLSWTESTNYSATIEADVPAGMSPADEDDYVRSLLLDDDEGKRWWEMLTEQKAMGECRCHYQDEVEHRQLLSVDIEDKDAS